MLKYFYSTSLQYTSYHLHPFLKGKTASEFPITRTDQFRMLNNDRIGYSSVTWEVLKKLDTTAKSRAILSINDAL